MENKQIRKAVWDAEASRIFCEIACKEAEEGNRPTKSLSLTGYNNLIEEFHKRTGRLYTQKQFKNRWDELKGIWTACVYYNQKATGLGWDPVKQTVTASEEQWADMIKVHKEVRRFRKGPPDNLDLLERMFHRASVTGNSSVMPGAEDIQETPHTTEINEDLIDLNDVGEKTPQPSPATFPKKRGAAAIACSPKKTKKDPYGKDFKRFVDHCISEEASSNMTIGNEIEAIMAEVIKCGAPETSDEYYIATKLFAKLENRYFFYAMKTSEGRLMWLRRQFEEKNKK